MNKKMNASEMIKDLAEKNEIRKILLILENSNSLDEAIEKVKALLNE